MAVAVSQTQKCCGYFQQIPEDTLKGAGKSFLFSTVAGTLITADNVTLGLCSGVGSMIASLIDSLIRPLINCCFSRDDRESSAYWWTKLCVSTILYSVLASLVVPLVGIPLHVNLIASISTQIVLRFFNAFGMQQLTNANAEVFTVLFA